MSNFNIATIMNLIFKPVIFVLYLSISLIFILCLQSIFSKQDTPELKDMGVSLSLTNGQSTLGVQDISESVISENLLQGAVSDTQTIFGDLIIYIFSIFLLW